MLTSPFTRAPRYAGNATLLTCSQDYSVTTLTIKILLFRLLA